jgi:hypothetical protein
LFSRIIIFCLLLVKQVLWLGMAGSPQLITR